MLTGGSREMVIGPKPIEVTAEIDWASILDDASEEPVLLERHGVVFQLTRQYAQNDIRYEPDAEQVRKVLDDTAGIWADLDVEQAIEDVYAARAAGSGTAERP